MNTWRDRMRQQCRKLKEEKGVTQEQIARHMGRGQSAIGNWLAGRGSPEVEEFPALAEILECDPVWLAFGESVFARYTLSQSFDGLSGRQQEKLLELVQALTAVA